MPRPCNHWGWPRPLQQGLGPPWLNPVMLKGPCKPKTKLRFSNHPGISISSSIMVATTSILTNSAHAFLLLHALANTCFLYFYRVHFWKCELLSHLFFVCLFSDFVFSVNMVLTTINYTVKFPTCGKIAGVSKSRVQWISLSLRKLPSWSWLSPLPG